VLEMKPSLPEDWDKYKQLWETAFGDTDDYIDNFRQNAYRPEGMVTLKDDGKLCSMLALFPMKLRWSDGGVTKASYLYALATDPDRRGQGMASILLSYTDFYIGEQAVPFLSTVPAEPSLEKFFAASGFQPCHPIDEAEVEAPAGGKLKAMKIGAAEYLLLRESLLEDMAHAIYDEEYLAYQEKVSALFGGGLYRVDTPAGPACAVAEVFGDLLMVKELLSPKGEQQTALAALAAVLPAKRCKVRCPAGKGELPGTVRRTFGMGKRVPPTPKQLDESYFGLAFD